MVKPRTRKVVKINKSTKKINKENLNPSQINFESKFMCESEPIF